MSTNSTQSQQLRDAMRSLMLAHGTINDGQRPCGTPLSTPHAWALLELLEHREMTVGELAARLGIDRTNVSRLCARMEELGELNRELHPNDARAKILRLSEVGLEVARSVDASSRAHFEDVLDKLEVDVLNVVEILEQLTDAMTHIPQP